jgi:cyclophilin family peptidyl-prolyl cis-trans isomerase
MTITQRVGIAVLAIVLLAWPTGAQQTSPGAGPVIVLETEKGVIEFETYPEEAPKTVETIVALVKRNFYNRQRFHRAEPNFLVQIGDPQSRNVLLSDYWGRGGSGKPIGVAEITKKRTHVRGAVAMAYAGSDPKSAESQFYILLRAAPQLNPKYTVFGKVIKGMEVVDKLEKADVLTRAYVKETPAKF